MSIHQKVFHSAGILSLTTSIIPQLVLTIFIAQKALPDTHSGLHEHLKRFDRRTLSVEYIPVDSTGYHYAVGGGDVNGDGLTDFALLNEQEEVMHGKTPQVTFYLGQKEWPYVVLSLPSRNENQSPMQNHLTSFQTKSVVVTTSQSRKQTPTNRSASKGTINSTGLIF